jgi:hypothetical protein
VALFPSACIFCWSSLFFSLLCTCTTHFGQIGHFRVPDKDQLGRKLYCMLSKQKIEHQPRLHIDGKSDKADPHSATVMVHFNQLYEVAQRTMLLLRICSLFLCMNFFSLPLCDSCLRFYVAVCTTALYSISIARQCNSSALLDKLY